MATMATIIRAMPLIMAPRSSLAAVAIAAVLAVLLAALAIPSLIASTMTLAHNDTLEAVRMLRKKRPATAALTAAATANERAAALFDSGRYRANVAAALFAMPAPERAGTGFDLEKEVRLSLAAAPASAYNWNRLAVLRLNDGDRAGALKAWEMSVLTGRYAPYLVNSRIFLAVRLFPIKDPVLVEMLVDQVHLSADASTDELARIAHKSGGAPFIQAVLWRDTEHGPAFNKAYRMMLRKDRWKYRRKMGLP